MDRIGALVLCGGESRRMGRPKAWLPIGGETLLGRVVRLVQTRAPIVVVSAAEGQELPPLLPPVEIVRDPIPGLGPLQGAAVGLGSMLGRVDWAFLCATDAPLLEPRWIDRLAELADPGFDLILPFVGGREQPLASLARPEAASAAAADLLRAGHRRLGMLRGRLRTRVVTEPELSDVDPDFRTLRNLNEPGDYDALVAALRDDHPKT